jgi:hypothetical protein
MTSNYTSVQAATAGRLLINYSSLFESLFNMWDCRKSFPHAGHSARLQPLNTPSPNRRCGYDDLDKSARLVIDES